MLINSFNVTLGGKEYTLTPTAQTWCAGQGGPTYTAFNVHTALDDGSGGCWQHPSLHAPAAATRAQVAARLALRVA